MKVVITGADSYIGNHIQAFIQDHDNSIEVTQLDVVDDRWRKFDFHGYDAIVHVAAIVHRKDVVDWSLYESVNVDLPETIARKAKKQGVKQFIFLSSMAVYRIGKALSQKNSVITAQTVVHPSSMYGKSKLLAEQRLASLESPDFCVAIVRPPNVYGPGCRGGYISTYASIVAKLPAIPNAFTSIKQSVLYIDNLSRFIYLLIRGQKRGVYTPQDAVSVSAVEIMQNINECLQLKKKTSALLGLFIYLIAFLPLVKKGYGGVAYAREISHSEEFDYQVISFEDGIRKTVLF